MKKGLMHGLGSKPKAKMKDARKHGIHSTTIDHLADGSHVVKHAGPAMDAPAAGSANSWSAPDMGALQAGMSDKLGQ